MEMSLELILGFSFSHPRPEYTQPASFRVKQKKMKKKTDNKRINETDDDDDRGGKVSFFVC